MGRPGHPLVAVRRARPPPGIAAHIHRRDRQAIAHAVATTVALLDDFGVEPEPETQMLLRQAEDHIGHPPALAV